MYLLVASIISHRNCLDRWSHKSRLIELGRQSHHISCSYMHINMSIFSYSSASRKSFDCIFVGFLLILYNLTFSQFDHAHKLIAFTQACFCMCTQVRVARTVSAGRKIVNHRQEQDTHRLPTGNVYKQKYVRVHFCWSALYVCHNKYPYGRTEVNFLIFRQLAEIKGSYLHAWGNACKWTKIQITSVYWENTAYTGPSPPPL